MTRHPFQLEASLRIASPILLYQNISTLEINWKPILEGKRPEVLVHDSHPS